MADDVEVRFGASIEGFLAGVEQVKSALQSITDPIDEIKSAFGELAEVIAAAFAIEKIVEFVDRMAHLGQQTEALAARLGISTEEVGGLGFVAQTAGLEVGNLAMALSRMSVALTNADEPNSRQARTLASLGIAARDAGGNLRPMISVLFDIADRFHETADGTQKTYDSLTLLGRAGASFIPVLDRGREGIEELMNAFKATGAELSGPAAEGMAKTHENVLLLGYALQGVGITLFNAFKPAIDDVIDALTNLVEGFNNAIKSGGNFNGLLTLIVGTVDVLIAGLRTVVTGVQQAINAVSGIIEYVTMVLAIAGRVMGDLAHGNIEQVKRDFEVGADVLKDIWQRHLDEMLSAGKDWAEHVSKLFSNISPQGFIDTTGGSKAEHGEGLPPLPAVSGKTTDRVSQWQTELTQMLEDEQIFFADVKAIEAKYWEDKLARADLGETEYASILSKVYAIHKQEAEDDAKEQDDMNKARRTAAQTRIQISQTELAQRKADLDTDVAYMRITESQKLAMLADFANQEYTLNHKELEDELNDDRLSMVQRQKLLDEMAKLEAKHLQQVDALHQQAAMSALRQWQSILAPISTAFDGMLQGMLQGTESFRATMGRMLGNLVLSFVEARLKIELDWLAGQLAMALGAQDWASKSLLAWVATQLGITTAQETTNATKLASDTTTAAASKAISATSGFSEIMTAAAVAAANAFAATAAIPIVGPALAPAAAAAAYAETSAWTAALALDVGAWNIPAVMPAILHPGEAVVPATFAEGMRQNGGFGGGPVSININMHSNANADSVARALKNAVRDMHRSTRLR